MKNDFTTLNETLNKTKEQLAMNSFLNNTLNPQILGGNKQNLAHKTYYTRPALKISLICSIFLDI